MKDIESTIRIFLDIEPIKFKILNPLDEQRDAQSSLPLRSERRVWQISKKLIKYFLVCNKNFLESISFLVAKIYFWGKIFSTEMRKTTSLTSGWKSFLLYNDLKILSNFSKYFFSRYFYLLTKYQKTYSIKTFFRN